MASERESQEERELLDLFEATAEQPPPATLTRLQARAVDIPAHVRRRPAWIPRWAWAPGIAGLAVAAGALAVTIAPWLTEEVETVPVAQVAGSLPMPAVVPPAAAPQVSASVDPASVSADDEEDDLASDWGDDVDELGSALDAPSEDADLDAWLHATAVLVNEP